MSKSFTFYARTIDGQIYADPILFTLECRKVIPTGFQIMKGVDDNFCYVATKVYLIQYGGKTLGSNDFKTTEEFLSYLDEVCGCCPEPESGCAITVGDCFLTVGDCKLII